MITFSKPLEQFTKDELKCFIIRFDRNGEGSMWNWSKDQLVNYLKVVILK